MDENKQPVLSSLLGVCYFVLFVFVNAHLQDGRMLMRVNSAPNAALSAEPESLRSRKTRCRLSGRIYQAVSQLPLPAQIQPIREFCQ
jgi:hypothetical protein